jgi:hypothetical protein
LRWGDPVFAIFRKWNRMDGRVASLLAMTMI